MEVNDRPPTPEEANAHAHGSLMALQTAVAAIVATSPDRQAILAQIGRLRLMADSVFLQTERATNSQPSLLHLGRIARSAFVSTLEAVTKKSSA